MNNDEVIRLTAPNGMFSLDLHPSLWEGLRREVELSAPTLGVEDADALVAWASTQSGQKGALARGIAGLIRCAGTLQAQRVLGHRPLGGFWEAVANA